MSEDKEWNIREKCYFPIWRNKELNVEVCDSIDIENLRQKLIEDINEVLSDNIMGEAFIKDEMIDIVNKRFGIEDD